MIKIGLCSYSCLTEEKKKSIFKPIFNLLKKYNDYEIIIISTEEDINKYIDNKYLFDYVITFSFYAHNEKYCGNQRKKIHELSYKNIIYIESSCLNDILINSYQLRYSLNNIYVHLQENKLDTKYINFQKKRLQIKKINDYKKDGSILLLLQNPRQYFISMDHVEYEIYINNIIEKIREHTDKKIIVRYKPKSSFRINIKDPRNNFIISSNTLVDDCNKSKYCISHSTNAVMFCFVHGLHMFSLSEFNIAHEISDNDLNKLNNPTIFSDEQKNNYLKKMLNSSFTMNEDYFINLLTPLSMK